MMSCNLIFFALIHSTDASCVQQHQSVSTRLVLASAKMCEELVEETQSQRCYHRGWHLDEPKGRHLCDNGEAGTARQQ